MGSFICAVWCHYLSFLSLELLSISSRISQMNIPSHKDDLPPFVVKPQVLGYLNAREAMDCADFFGCEMGDAFLLDYKTG